MAKKRKKTAAVSPDEPEREPTFLGRLGKRFGKFLDSQKDAISRATRELEQTKEKLRRKKEERSDHRIQCDDYVHNRSCTKCESLELNIEYLVLKIVDLESGLRRAQGEA
jgi:hypothetical protein